MRTIAGGALERKIFQPYPFYPDLLVIFKASVQIIGLPTLILDTSYKRSKKPKRQSRI